MGRGGEAHDSGGRPSDWKGRGRNAGFSWEQNRSWSRVWSRAVVTCSVLEQDLSGCWAENRLEGQVEAGGLSARSYHD